MEYEEEQKTQYIICRILAFVPFVFSLCFYVRPSWGRVYLRTILHDAEAQIKTNHHITSVDRNRIQLHTNLQRVAAEARRATAIQNYTGA